MNRPRQLVIFSVFSVLAIVSAFYIFRLQFSFDFEQFFPKGDPDLEFFRQFTEEFEADDNFLLIAVERKAGVFEQHFLEQFHDFSVKAKQLPYVLESQSLTKFSYPIKTPFAITTIPAIHIQQPERYEHDKKQILEDERFAGTLINETATALVVALKTQEGTQLKEASELMAALNALIATYDFEAWHYLGRPYFQQELVAMQKREVTISAIVSSILVTIILFLIFRKPWGVVVAFSSIALGMLIFMGVLGLAGRELNAMAALYPVLMIIVGTSDVIHIMSKYVDELQKGHNRPTAIKITIKEIGLATLLTSATTAIGFATLVSSRIQPIRDFGINSAIGVLIAYLTVIFFTSALLSTLKSDQIIKLGQGNAFWKKLMEWVYQFTRQHPRRIFWISTLTVLICAIGISQITTNYSIINNLPKNQPITEDFIYFQNQLTGFRPYEIAVFTKNNYTADDYKVLQEMDKLETYLQKNFPSIEGTLSATAIYKSINRMYNGNRVAAYQFPETEEEFLRYQYFAERIPQLSNAVLLSKDHTKARISSRIKDIGADSIKAVSQRIDQWIAANTDSTIVEFRRTGTGLIMDKNSEYVRRSLLLGLGSAILTISLLMALLFRSWKLLIVSIIPNIFPLLLAGALLGFVGIELEAGISIIFAVIFGIAVDDTIHFLSKYKLARAKGLDVEESLHITFLETGKAIVLTTIILFFGFLVMLFSIHPPSVTVGLLISITLVSALISDLFLIPVLIRWLMKPRQAAPVAPASLTETEIQ